MNGEEEIKIVISADTSELDKALDKTVKNTEKNAKKLEKSFDGLREDVEKLKQGFNFNQTKNSGLNGLTKQFDKLKQTATKVASSIQKSLSKAFNITGKVKVTEDVQVDKSENNTSTNNMGANLATTGMLGAMLSKSKNLGEKISKPIINVLEMVKQLGKMLESINKIKVGGEDFDVAFRVDSILEYGDAWERATGETLKFGQTVDLINSRLQDAQSELNETEVYADGLQSALYDIKMALESMSLGGKRILVHKDEFEKIERLKAIIKETEQVISTHLQNHSINVPINPQSLTGIKQLASDLINSTQGFNKWKLVASNAMQTVKYSIEEVVDGIAKKLNGGEIPKALTVFRQFKQQISSAFKAGFDDSKTYLDKMINKIKQWANNHKQATKEVKSANKSTGASFKSLLQQMLPFASLYGVFTGLKNSITSFVDMGETVSKFNTVFGDMSDNAMKWADDLSSSVAVSKSELMDASSNIMAIGKSMGLTTDKAYEMAISMSELATDMDSFYNATDSLSKVRSALTGEYEPLKAYGIVLTEDAVKAKALAMGLDKASNSSKMLARQALITEQMMASGAMGDATRTANSLSNQLKMLKYNFQALGQAIGSCFGGLLQVVVPVLNKIVSACTVAFNKLAGLINSIFGLFGVKVGGGSSSGGIGSVIGDAIGDMNTSLGSAGAGSGDLADNLADGAKSAEKIAGLMGIDELNVLSSDKGDSGSGNGSSGGNGGAGDLGSVDMGDLMDWSNTESITDVLAGELTEFEQAFLSVFERIKAGFMLFKDSIVSEWTKLKINVNKLGQEIVDFFTSCWSSGLDDTALIFGALLGTITNTALQVANSVVQVVTGLFEHLNPNNNENTSKFIDGLNNLLMQIQGFIKDAGKWFSQFATACQPFINNLGDIAMIVGTILAQAFADGIQLVRDFMNSFVGQALIESFAQLLEDVSGALESCLGFIRDNQTLFEALAVGITVAYGAFKLINGAIALWNGLMTIFASIGAICSGVATALGGAIAFLTSPIGLVVVAIGALVTAGVLLWKNWDKVKAWCSKTWNAIVKIFDKVKDKVTKVFKEMYDKVSDVVSDIWDEFKDKFPNLADIVEDVFRNVKNIVEKYFDNVKTIIKAVIDVVKALFKGDFSSIGGIVKDAFEKVKSNTQSILDSIKGLIQARLDAIKLVFSTIWNAISSTATSIWNAISSTIKSVWDGISSYFSQVLNAIKNTISGVLNGISTLFSGVWNTIKSIVSGTLTGIQNAINTVMNSIKNTISTIVNAISNVFSTVFNNVYNVISTIFNSIKTVITNAINSAKTNVSNVVNAISSVFSNGFNNAKNVASTVFNAIKTTISNVMNTVKTSVSNIVNGISSVFSNGFNGAKNTISNIFNGIKSVISTPLNSVKSTVSSICTTIGNSFKNSFNNAKTTVSNAINSMKNTISSVMNTVKSTISGAVSKIKSYFNFSWSLPKPKMPKFEAKWSTVFGVKIPTGFNITWHKDGGIFTQPTVLGNHGFGEAGHEAILPLSDFYKKEDERFNKLAQQITKNNTNNQPVSIVLELDGQTLGKVTYNSLETLTKTGKIDLGRLL